MADRWTMHQAGAGQMVYSKANANFTNVNIKTGSKQNYVAFWGNKQTMNLNHLIYENIMISPYFNKTLANVKTYHEALDEIYQHVDHLEPWERGTRRTTGQTGMCGGVRGVGAGGVISSAYCILYKLFTIKLTKKQIISMLNHADSCYIRGLGFMYIRYCMNPNSFWYWFEPYLDDEEEIDPKSGGGAPTTMGNIIRQMLTKLDWFSTLFPRIPVAIQKDIETKLQMHDQEYADAAYEETSDIREPAAYGRASKTNYGQEESVSRDSSEEHYRRAPRASPDVKRRPRSRSREMRRHRDRSPASYRKSRKRSTSRRRSHHHRERSRSRSYNRRRHDRSLSKERHRHRHSHDSVKRKKLRNSSDSSPKTPLSRCPESTYSEKRPSKNFKDEKTKCSVSSESEEGLIESE